MLRRHKQLKDESNWSKIMACNAQTEDDFTRFRG